MDAGQFDALARALTPRPSRRGLLRTLISTVTGLALSRRASRVVAQSGPLDPGDPCQNDTQCVASGTTCEYVGQTDDYRCCGDEGSRCAGDADCCGWLVCPPGDFSGAFCANACTSAGCTCIAGAIGACDDGLMCCAQGDPGVPGICLTTDACYVAMASFNAEGDPCAVAAPNACADDLFCCGSGDVGTCQTAANC